MYKQNKTKTLYFPERIVEAMKGIFDYPLTIVEAPMGYGKTTAVREHLCNANAHILWLKIHGGSIYNFWNGFCRLLGKLDERLANNLVELGFPNDKVSFQEALKLIVDIELPKKTVLVIDDYHLLNGTDVGAFIEFLVVNEIDHLQIVLTTRFIELQSMEELFLKGYLHHITKETFELMPNEIIKYYKLCGIRIKATEADKLYAITEGWISALYLLMLNYQETGSLITTHNIYKLIENAIYKHFSEDIKEFLLSISIFDSFSETQAVHMWGNENAKKYLDKITRINAFVNYDARSKTYQIHNIFTNFLREIIEKEDFNYMKNLYEKAGSWYLRTGEYLAAMHFFYLARDFDNLLLVVELDKTNSIVNEQKELLIQYFEECPEEYKRCHLVAVLSYAMCLMTFNEMELFEKAAGEFTVLLQSSNLDPERIKCLMGEFELLLSFTKYNDMMEMSKHQKKACELLEEPSVFMDTKGSWTFGSPSVLYIFHRESGTLENKVMEIKEAIQYYYQLTNGHGMGGEHVMAAEWYFHQGDFENAEIALHKALYVAQEGPEPSAIICALFLQIRLCLMQGDYACILELFEKMRERIEFKKNYVVIHTIDLCIGFVYTCLNQKENIPEWLVKGDFDSSCIYFQARAFANIIYGRVLLINGEYLKLLGIADKFLGIASIFPNILANIYTAIYIAAANERIYRRGEAIQALKQVLDMALPDRVYMPFVENCDYIKPLLEELYNQGTYREDIARILMMSKQYQKAVDQITKEYLKEDKPRLTAREDEIARLAAEGFSNKGIGDKLFISQNTVKTQLKSIFEKLGINSRSLLKQYFEQKS
ncbi:LuxR C-terminal-related transcriptional regulator [Petroclostridium sp. X23]|uniref:LuxR C-terminal-related transcriptional regulator n=1 Tax=Petroclostridium sp. X23 TaxID=3045146 RepID=UPI0024AE717E|nr:LuxR C-terminal-related transcriptional regulator [Petroclostridium sp. X23]WHH57748.1 LuxR C-terminal-related transcriptional regulator [Petroclostridium sp. X23]